VAKVMDTPLIEVRSSQMPATPTLADVVGG